MEKLKTKDLNGGNVIIIQYGNNLVWIRQEYDTLIDKELAKSIIKELSENFSL